MNITYWDSFIKLCLSSFQAFTHSYVLNLFFISTHLYGDDTPQRVRRVGTALTLFSASHLRVHVLINELSGTYVDLSESAMSSFSPLARSEVRLRRIEPFFRIFWVSLGWMFPIQEHGVTPFVLDFIPSCRELEPMGVPALMTG